jgi:hypothetical protein
MTALRLVVLAAATACGLEFSEPVLDTPALLRVVVTLTDSAPAGEARVSGSLWPGYDADGAVRTLTDSSLRVMGRTLTPDVGLTTDAPSDIVYAESWGLDPEAPLGPVELEAPAIQGIGEPAPVFRVTPPWRLGPANLTVNVDSTLKLDLVTEILPADTISERWRLLVEKDGRWVAQLYATGPVPPRIEVPWALLSGLGTGGQVILDAYQSVITPRDRRYSVLFALSTRHTWFVTVQP